jgi:hypothetical protein
MFRSISKFGVAVAAVLALSAAGCGGAAGDLEPGEVDDAGDAKADGQVALRMGSYDVNLPPYWALTLEQNGTFTLRGGCKPGPTGPHCFAIITDEGHYRLTRSGSKRYLRLYSDIQEGKLIYRFQYTVSGRRSEDVKLTETHTGDTSTATLEEADKSQEGESCGGFVASVNQCATGLVCKAAARCCDLPGVCVQAN